MNKIVIFLSLLLFVASEAYSQEGPADTIFWSVANFSMTGQPTDSTFTLTAVHPGDQSGQGWIPTMIQVGYRIFDSQGRMYEVLSISADLTNSTATVKELQDLDIGPAGVGWYYRPIPGSNRVPVPPIGNNGIAPSTQNKAITHNALNGGDGTGNACKSTMALINTQVDRGGNATLSGGSLVQFVADSNAIIYDFVFAGSDFADDLVLNADGSNVAAVTAEFTTIMDSIENLTGITITSNNNAVTVTPGTIVRETFLFSYDYEGDLPTVSGTGYTNIFGTEAISPFTNTINSTSFERTFTYLADTTITYASATGAATPTISGDTLTITSTLENQLLEAVTIDIATVCGDTISYRFAPRGDDAYLLTEQEVLGLYVRDVQDDKTWYVHPTYGDNATAQKGNRTKPLADIWALRDTIQAGEIGYFLPAEHSIGTNADNDVIVDGATYYISQGAVLDFTGSAQYFVGDSLDVFTVAGPGKIEFDNYFPVDPEYGVELNVIVDSVEASGYITRVYKAPKKIYWKSENVLLANRSFCRLSYLKGTQINYDIGNIYHQNTNNSVDYPTFLFFDNDGALGVAVDTSDIRISVDYINTNATAFAMYTSSSTGPVAFNAANINVEFGIVDQTRFAGNTYLYSPQAVFGIGGDQAHTYNNSSVSFKVGQTRGGNGLFNFYGAGSISPINMNNSQINIRGDISGEVHQVGSLDKIGKRNNTGTVDANSYIYVEGNFATTDTSAVIFGTGYPLIFSGLYQSSETPFSINSDSTQLLSVIATSTGGDTILYQSNTAVDLLLCGANVAQAVNGNVSITNICGGLDPDASTVSNDANNDLTEGTDGLPYYDAPDNLDNDPTNEYNTNITLNGNNLEITDGGGTLIEDISGIDTDTNLYTDDGSIPAATTRAVTIPSDSEIEYTAGAITAGTYTAQTTTTPLDDDGTMIYHSYEMSAHGTYLRMQNVDEVYQLNTNESLSLIAQNGMTVSAPGGSLTFDRGGANTIVFLDTPPTLTLGETGNFVLGRRTSGGITGELGIMDASSFQVNLFNTSDTVTANRNLYLGTNSLVIGNPSDNFETGWNPALRAWNYLGNNGSQLTSIVFAPNSVTHSLTSGADISSTQISAGSLSMDYSNASGDASVSLNSFGVALEAFDLTGGIRLESEQGISLIDATGGIFISPIGGASTGDVLTKNAAGDWRAESPASSGFTDNLYTANGSIPASTKRTIDIPGTSEIEFTINSIASAVVKGLTVVSTVSSDANFNDYFTAKNTLDSLVIRDSDGNFQINSSSTLYLLAENFINIDHGPGGDIRLQDAPATATTSEVGDYVLARKTSNGQLVRVATTDLAATPNKAYVQFDSWGVDSLLTINNRYLNADDNGSEYSGTQGDFTIESNGEITWDGANNSTLRIEFTIDVSMSGSGGTSDRRELNFFISTNSGTSTLINSGVSADMREVTRGGASFSTGDYDSVKLVYIDNDADTGDTYGIYINGIDGNLVDTNTFSFTGNFSIEEW